MTEVDDFIRSWGFETRPLEECAKRSQELWDNSLLGQQALCHGCGRKRRFFGMVLILGEAEHPDDGWYCSPACYEMHRSDA